MLFSALQNSFLVIINKFDNFLFSFINYDFCAKCLWDKKMDLRLNEEEDVREPMGQFCNESNDKMINT